MTLSETQYQCAAGETFDSVALEIYGDEKYACELMAANPLFCTVPMFVGGELLELPVVDIPDEDETEDDPEEAVAPDEAPWKE